MRILVMACLLVVGLIHLLPLPGLLGAERLAALYGITVADPNLLLLLRHRAVLFGIIGVYCVLAAFRPVLQPGALAAAWCSVVAFLLLAWSGGSYNAQLARVVTADLVALVCLVIASVVLLMQRRRR